MITIDRTDLAFQLHDLLDSARLAAHARFADYDRAAIDGVLDTAERIAIDHFLPHAALLDANEPAFVDGKVKMDDAVGEALRHYREAGFFGAAFDHEWGGMQMPETVRQAAAFMFMMANVGTSGYPFLTAGAANLVASFGSPTQKELFLRPMVEGRFFGTMCLSEPQAGFSLSDITTSAVPAGDGEYRIAGRKMWISGGDHEIADNIVHMVIARIDGAPPGVKGISLFIVPKYRLGPNGEPAERNGVVLAGLNHKMGYRGTTNTLLHFGEDEPAIGCLLGEPHRGLAYMFQMMNEARIGVGLGAVALAAAGYRASLAYARERPQGRHPDSKDPASQPAVAIIGHADVKRLLLAQKAAVEGGLSLALYAADLVDRIRVAQDGEARREDERLLDLLTPLVKSWPSEYCLEANKHAIQVLGGYGYTRDYPVERLYRDNRLNPIHEGTHGIQAMDLLGRKVTQAGGTGVKTLAAHLSETVATTGRLAGTVAENPRLGLANATIYLDMLGHVVIAWMWLRQAVVAAGKRANGEGNPDFLDGKLAACRYFFVHELPAARVKRELLDSLDDTTLTMRPAWF